MSGNVNQRQAVAAQVQRGEAQVDGDPARALGRQTVGVDPGQGTHKRGLPVIDVASRAEDEVFLI
jgi:hypothetical protein